MDPVKKTVQSYNKFAKNYVDSTFDTILQYQLTQFTSFLKGKKILVCGVSYRQDVGDTRFSPSETLVMELIAQGALVTCHDPYIRYWNELKISMSEQLPPSADFNAIILAVPHHQYLDFDWSRDYADISYSKLYFKGQELTH